MFWSAGCSLLRAEGFSCSLDDGRRLWRLGINALQFLIWTYLFFSCEVLVIKTLDLDPEPDPHWPKMLDLDPHWNQCGSETLVPYVPVLRIRDVYPVSRILIFTHPGSRISDPGSRIPDPGFRISDPGSRIQKQQQKRGVKKNLLS